VVGWSFSFLLLSLTGIQAAVPPISSFSLLSVTEELPFIYCLYLYPLLFLRRFPPPHHRIFFPDLFLFPLQEAFCNDFFPSRSEPSPSDSSVFFLHPLLPSSFLRFQEISGRGQRPYSVVMFHFRSLFLIFIFMETFRASAFICIVRDKASRFHVRLSPPFFKIPSFYLSSTE